MECTAATHNRPSTTRSIKNHSAKARWFLLENVKKECIVRYSVVKMCVVEKGGCGLESVGKGGEARAVHMTKQSSEILQQFSRSGSPLSSISILKKNP